METNLVFSVKQFKMNYYDNNAVKIIMLILMVILTEFIILIIIQPELF